MIVACPSCQTRYRQPPPPGLSDPEAQCTKCDEVFPMTEAKRNYVLLPGSGVRPAAGLADAAQAHRGHGAVSNGDPFAVDGAVAGDRAVEMPEEETAAGAPRGRMADVLVALAPAALCAGIAYYLAAQRQLDPVSLTALGGAAGLLLGWGCMLWMRRND